MDKNVDEIPNTTVYSLKPTFQLMQELRAEFLLLLLPLLLLLLLLLFYVDGVEFKANCGFSFTFRWSRLLDFRSLGLSIWTHTHPHLKPQITTMELEFNTWYVEENT